MSQPTAHTEQYKAYGLSIHSCIACPELPRTKQAPDIKVSYGRLPENLENPKKSGLRFQVSTNELMLNVDGVARFLIRNGNEVIIDREPASSDDTIRLFLLGSAIGGILAQRKHLILHASVIKTSAGAIAFAGPSGIGKSTLANAFMQHGYSILSDDLCVLETDQQGVFHVHPAYPQIKLWADTIKNFGQAPERFRKVRPDINKHALPVEKNFFSQIVPLKKVYILNVANSRSSKQLNLSEDFSILPLKGAEAFEVVRKNTYRFQFLQGLGMQKTHFEQCANLISNYPVNRVYRPAEGFALPSLCKFLENDFSK